MHPLQVLLKGIFVCNWFLTKKVDSKGSECNWERKNRCAQWEYLLLTSLSGFGFLMISTFEKNKIGKKKAKVYWCIQHVKNALLAGTPFSHSFVAFSRSIRAQFGPNELPEWSEGKFSKHLSPLSIAAAASLSNHLTFSFCTPVCYTVPILLNSKINHC